VRVGLLAEHTILLQPYDIIYVSYDSLAENYDAKKSKADAIDIQSEVRPTKTQGREALPVFFV
jgi:hypothetical protein